MSTQYVYPCPPYAAAVDNAANTDTAAPGFVQATAFPGATVFPAATATAVPAAVQSTGFAGGWLNFSNTGYLKGFAVGAAAALVLTNPTVQKALVTGVVKIWSAVQGGVEEVKEQIQDVKAEMSQDKE